MSNKRGSLLRNVLSKLFCLTKLFLKLNVFGDGLRYFIHICAVSKLVTESDCGKACVQTHTNFLSCTAYPLDPIAQG